MGKATFMRVEILQVQVYKSLACTRHALSLWSNLAGAFVLFMTKKEGGGAVSYSWLKRKEEVLKYGDSESTLMAVLANMWSSSDFDSIKSFVNILSLVPWSGLNDLGCLRFYTCEAANFVCILPNATIKIGKRSNWYATVSRLLHSVLWAQCK